MNSASIEDWLSSARAKQAVEDANKCRGMRVTVGACELLSEDANRCRACDWLSESCDWLKILKSSGGVDFERESVSIRYAN